MIGLNLNEPEDLAEAFYLALVSVEQLDGRLGSRLWRNLKKKQRDRWLRAAERVVRLYEAEGISLGALKESKDDHLC